MKRFALPVALLLLAAPARAQSDTRPPTTTPTTPATPAQVDVELRDRAFDPARLRERRRALVASLPEGSCVLVGAGPRGDDTFPFRPRPDFLYLSGVRDAECTLLLTAQEDVLFAPPRDLQDEVWNDPRVAPGTELAARSGFGEVAASDGLVERLAAILARGGMLHVSGVDAAKLNTPLPTPVRRAEPAIARLRLLKDPGEQALLARAIDITAAALTEAIRSIGPGQTEYQVQSVIEYLFARHGAQRPGFATIVGAGPNSCVLHHQGNRGLVRDGDLVVMDVGAELWGYTADVTRTVPASGRFTPRQRELYELVLAAQEAGFKAVRPGVTVRQVDAAARAVIAKAGYGRFFPHGTSHWLGLDVHDVGAYDTPLAPGMVLTVEPGIYIPDEGLGIRIEDDVLVTGDGGRVLSLGVPREVAALEALLAQRGIGDAPVLDPIPPGGAPATPAEPEAPPRRFFRLR